MAWEDDDVSLINDYEGDTFKERYDNAKKDVPDLFPYNIADKFNNNIKIDSDNKEKITTNVYKKEDISLINDYEGATFADRYTNAKADNDDLEELDYYKPKVVAKSKPSESYNGFSINDGGDSAFKLPLIETVNPEDGSTTLPTSELNKREQTPKELKEQYDKLSTNPKLKGWTSLQLLEGGVNPKIVDKLMQDEALSDSGALESPMLDPMGLTLENKLFAPILAVGGKALVEPLIKMWKNRGIPRSVRIAIENGDKAELERYLGSIEEIKGMGLGDEIFTSGKSLKGNDLEKQRWYDTKVKSIEKKVKGKVDESIPYNPSVAEDMQKTVGKMDDEMYQGTQDAYKAVEDATSDKLYNVKEFKDSILRELQDRGVPREVFSEVRSNLDYLGRNLTFEQSEFVEQLNKLSPKITSARAKKSLLEDKLLALEKDSATTPEALKTAREKLTAQGNKLTNYTTKQKALKSNLPDTDYANEKEFARLIRRFNEKLRTGGNLSTKDKQVSDALKLASKRTREQFELSTKETNSEVYEAFSNAQSKFKEYMDLFGKGEDLGAISNASDANVVLSSIMANPDKVRRFGKAMIERGEPELAKEFANNYLQKIVGSVGEGSGEMFKKKGVDLASVSSKLDNILGNKETKQFITDTLGEDKVKELDKLFNITRGLDDIMKNVGTKGVYEEGLYSGTSGMKGNVARTIKLIKEKVGMTVRDSISGVTKSVGNKLRGVMAMPQKPDLGNVDIMDRAIGLVKTIQDGGKQVDIDLAYKKLGSLMAGVSREGEQKLENYNNLPKEVEAPTKDNSDESGLMTQLLNKFKGLYNGN